MSEYHNDEAYGRDDYFTCDACVRTEPYVTAHNGTEFCEECHAKFECGDVKKWQGNILGVFKDKDGAMTCNKCGSTESSRWHLFPLDGETFEGALCEDCYKDADYNCLSAEFAPKSPVHPDSVNALLSSLSQKMCEVAHQAQLATVSMHDEATADAVRVLLLDHEDVIQKLTDMAEARRGKLING